MKVWRASLIACLVPIGACPPVNAAPRLRLAGGGSTEYVIALAKGASAPDGTAARELADHLNQVTGADFEILSSSEAVERNVIAVGPGASRIVSPDLDLSFDEIGHDGIIVKTHGPHLILTGAEGANRGTLYAGPPPVQQPSPPGSTRTVQPQPMQ